MPFDMLWFARWQRTLVGLLNAPLVGIWFRWVLCIHPQEPGYRRPIVCLMPHAYVLGEPDGSTTIVFRTHQKYAKRLYYAFKPFWWALHAWDWAVADRWVPRLSFGFTNLQSFPDPLNPSLGNTVDGGLRRSGVSETFAEITAGAGTSVFDADAGYLIYYTQVPDTAGKWGDAIRYLATFDTSAIGAGGTLITVAGMGIYPTSRADSAGLNPNAGIYAATPASNNKLVPADYSQIDGATVFGTYSVMFLSLNTYNATTFNLAGRLGINKVGITKLGARELQYDAGGVNPGALLVNANMNLAIDTADRIGTATDPFLTVTYQASTTASFGAGSDLNSSVLTYLRDTVYGAPARSDLTTLWTRRMRELGGDQTAAFKSIIRAAGVPD